MGEISERSLDLGGEVVGAAARAQERAQDLLAFSHILRKFFKIQRSEDVGIVLRHDDAVVGEPDVPELIPKV